ncbi:MAG: glycosyl transferase family 1 [Rhizobiales bacterium 62-17]|nr:glycosyltransferase [Hyphomicrobiales bacterium]OJY04561.1 MAG: glycosyl transferase family 1 [Rhizobiales bacterium 62-17]
MVRLVEPRHYATLEDYESTAHLNGTVSELRREAKTVLPSLQDRRVWMVSSTERGGGVAESLPPFLTLLRALGVQASWLVMETEDADFFRLTKRLHNLIHGEGDTTLGPAERELYDRVSHENAEAIQPYLSPGDVLIVHDPQPMGAGARLRTNMDIAAVWRCHIGLDQQTPETQAAWDFLDPYAAIYDHAVFTASEYIPSCLTGRAAIIHPAIDPLSHKNRELSVHKVVGILANGAWIRPPGEMLTPPFPETTKRLQRDGTWAPATEPEDIGLLYRPIITQVSRWDRLKGFLPLMQAFAILKQDFAHRIGLSERHRQTLQLVRLVLAGPDPKSVDDDPEGLEVLGELRAAYAAMDAPLQDDIAIISMPMSSRKYNALLINVLQRCSDIVAQNSLQEGFGLTVTEAMWKHAAIVASQATGIRQQIRTGLDGWLVANPEDPKDIAEALDALLGNPWKREAFGKSAQLRVHGTFLVFDEVRHWLALMAEVAKARWPLSP